MVACGECRIDWPAGGAATCTQSEHLDHHRRYELHLHRATVPLPDGTAIVPVSFYAGDPYGRDQPPGFGLYLDGRWQPPWPHQHLAWPDFGVPAARTPVVAALGSLLDRARAGQRVEVGCWGGHGRTGTALACLAVLAGHPAGDAVGWVRSHYCDRAIETGPQETFVQEMSGS